MSVTCRPSNFITLGYLVSMAISCTAWAEDHFAIDRSNLKEIVELLEPRLTESSGLAVSYRAGHLLWTHNDSGDTPRLFAFDRHGQRTGQINLHAVADAVDWEDMASLVDDGIPRLLVADCGDNVADRSSITLYLFDEPDPYQSTHQDNVQRILLTYPNGARDCEAVAVDIRRRLIVLVTKSLFPVSEVYVVPLPKRVSGSDEHTFTATRIATLPMPMVTGIDFDPVSGDIWIVSYLQAYRFACTNREMSIAEQFASLPKSFELPRWKQIEAIAVDREQQVWVTSEGSPTPLGRLSFDGSE